MTVLQRSVASLAASLTIASCSPHVPGIADPYKVDAHCSPRQARITGIRSVLTSTDDKRDDGSPSLAEIEGEVRSGDGAIAYWHGQPLAIPKVARGLGASDGYAHVDALAIPPATNRALYRHVYMLVDDRGTKRWIVMRAFDVQDVCVEGVKQQ